MTTTRSRLLAAVASAALLLGAGACGSGNDDDTKASGSKSDSTASASPSGAASSGSDDATGSDDDGDSSSGQLTKDDFVTEVVAAMKEKKTAHLVMDLGSSVSANADVQYGDGKTTAMKMDMSMGGQKVQMILLGDVMYMQTAGGKYQKIDKNTPGMEGMFEQLSAMGPDASIKAMTTGLKDVKYVGEDTVEGTKVDKYAVTVDTAKLAETMGMTEQVQGMPKTVSYDLYLDAEHLIRRLVMSISGQSITMTMSDWGKPVDIKAPPASQIASK
jgi:hypothetical protein